jgi:large subunit ribosomal protein L13
MDMNRCFFLKKEERAPRWHKIDASGKVLGRLATQVADMLRGKDKAEYTPHTDSGDYVVITNCDQIVLTGNKWEGKTYISYSGWMSGKKERSAREVAEKDSTLIFKHAVRRMLPKTKLGRQVFKKLRVYSGDANPHEAQLIGFRPKENS